MKRYGWRLLILSMTIVLMLGSGACGADTDTPATSTYVDTTHPVSEPAQNLVFSEGEIHYSTDTMRRVFKTLSAADGVVTLAFEHRAYDAQAAPELWQTLQEDIARITAALDLDVRPLTLYVVETLPGGIVQAGDRLYCLAEDVTGGAYRHALAVTLLGPGERWHRWEAMALGRYAHGEMADSAALSAYYREAEDMDILSLFPAYFIPGFATEIQVEIARDTALSLAAFAIERDGLAAVLDGGLEAYKQAWLESMGVSCVYEDAYGGFFQGYRFASDGDYPLIVTTSRGDIVRMQAVPGLSEQARAVKDFFWDMESAMAALFQTLEAHAPQHVETIRSNYAQPISFCIRPNIGVNVTYSSSRQVFLRTPQALFHEITHLLVPGEGRGETWKLEAICEYFSINHYISRSLKAHHFFRLLTEFDDVAANDDPETVAWVALGHTLYLEQRDMPQSPRDIDYPLYLKMRTRAYFVVSLEREDLVSIADVYADAANTDLPRRGGNNLSYTEAYLFADYLIEQHGLPAFLDFCFEKAAFRELYGQSFDDAHAGFLEEIGAVG